MNRYKLLTLLLLVFTSQQTIVDELHVVKNNGMQSHEVYLCSNTRACYELYRAKWFFDRNINCATKMWIERDKRVIMRLKGR